MLQYQNQIEEFEYSMSRNIVNNTSAYRGSWNHFIIDIFIWLCIGISVMVWSTMALRSSNLPEITAGSRSWNWKSLSFWKYLVLKSSLGSRCSCGHGYIPINFQPLYTRKVFLTIKMSFGEEFQKLTCTLCGKTFLFFV